MKTGRRGDRHEQTIGSGGGIGNYARQLIRSGHTSDETLAAVMKRFPDAATTLKSVKWYRSRLRRDGEDVHLDVEVGGIGVGQNI
jgi:hypothetical protein